MTFLSIDHPAISCQDPRKLADWYCKHFGMQLIADDGKEPPSLLVGYASDTKTSCMVELMPTRHPGTPPIEMPRFCQGLRHFAIRVSDFDKAYELMKAAGVTFMFEPLQAIGGGKVVSFRDPEGNEVQIVQR
jgi:glyoxylase I family protein